MTEDETPGERVSLCGSRSDIRPFLMFILLGVCWCVIHVCPNTTHGTGNFTSIRVLDLGSMEVNMPLTWSVDKGTCSRSDLRVSSLEIHATWAGYSIGDRTEGAGIPRRSFQLTFWPVSGKSGSSRRRKSTFCRAHVFVAASFPFQESSETKTSIEELNIFVVYIGHFCQRSPQ